MHLISFAIESIYGMKETDITISANALPFEKNRQTVIACGIESDLRVLS